MNLIDKISSFFGRPRKSPPKGMPQVVARVSRDEEFVDIPNISDWQFVPAKFPFAIYDLVEQYTILDPYVADYVQTTVSLGNPGHKLYITAPNDTRADEAIQCCNEFAARCFPFGGGMDGLINSILSQLARMGATCIEWVPTKVFSQIERAFVLPIKTIRFRSIDNFGNLELVQVIPATGKIVRLQPVQTSYHGLILRDSNPYSIPPAVSAIEACSLHKTIMKNVKDWVEKVSGLGVLLASIEPPPREPNETQEQYDNKARIYLEQLAKTIQENLNSGLGIGYNNISFQFHNTQAGAQGAKEILQVVLQGLFAALQRDPIFFGWNFGTTETLARVVYQKMLQDLKLFQLGAKRTIEHGHRLNLALNGLGDIGLSVKFNDEQTLDVFKMAEAEQMKAQAVVTQLEANIIDREEARRLLGHEDKKIEAGAYVASFNKDKSEYSLDSFKKKMFSFEGYNDEKVTSNDEGADNGKAIN